MEQPKRSACLIVIDGWGISEETKGNAILAADTPVMDAFAKNKRNYGELSASGLDVGLPAGLMGNSEVGHLNIGAGRIVYQDIVRIDLQIEQGGLKTNPNLVKAFESAKSGGGRVHFLGLVSDGGVHSHIRHLKALLAVAKESGIPESYVHFFSDGRDTPPQSCSVYLNDLQEFIEKTVKYGEIVSLMGRYYAMDRDKRWERILIAYQGLVRGEGEKVKNVKELEEGIKHRYAAKEMDEFLKPFILNPKGSIKDGDVLISFDFRSDRMRQIVETFWGKGGMWDLPEAKNEPRLPNVKIYTLTQYNEVFPFPLLFPPQRMENVLSEWLSKNHIKQFHTAETEKYAHVTFFFNGGVEKQFEGEERKLVPSPKVATYDLKPEMSVHQVADELVAAIDKGNEFPFIMCNFAPPDMVGHTGEYEPTVKACQFTDQAIGRVLDACKKHNRLLFVTADHGNAEKMIDEKGGKFTAHTTNLVPFVLFDPSNKVHFKEESPKGTLPDVAPTVLSAMGLSIPEEITGKSLVDRTQ